MKKIAKFLSVLCIGSAFFTSSVVQAAEKLPKADEAQTIEQTTRPDAVIFKVHDINPVSEDGVVTGCDFTVTFYNRTAINFRSFTLNMLWNDSVDEHFKFDKYMESFFSPEDLAKQKELLGEDSVSRPLQTAVSVNAFGADKQVSIRSHVNSEKCYLMLTDASYTIPSCDIVRSIDSKANNISNQDCTKLFQFVSTSNPEYFGQFKKQTATEIVEQEKVKENSELADIDAIIGKIVENLGTSDKALTGIN